jgi:tetratricopeptide (TPR) repeat protein
MKQGKHVVGSWYFRRAERVFRRLAWMGFVGCALALAGCARVSVIRSEVSEALRGQTAAASPAAAGDDVRDGSQLSPTVIANTYLQHGRYAEGERRLREYLARHPGDRAAQSLLRQLTIDPRDELGTASRIYVVQPGDSYSTLAARYLGDAGRFLVLARYNGSTNPSALHAGDTVRLPMAPVRAPAADTLVVRANPADAPPADAPAPGNGDAYANALRLQAESTALLKQGRKSDALARLDQALKLDPHLKPAGDQTLREQLLSSYHERAVLLYRDQKLDQAIALWDHVLDIDPGYERAVIYRARAVELKQRLKQL